MPLRMRSSVEIQAPIQDVYAVIANPERLPEWNGSISAARRCEPDAPVALGSRAVVQGRLLGQSIESETEVVICCPPTEFATRAIRGPRLVTRFKLASQMDGTHVDVDVVGEVPGGTIGTRLAEGFLRSEFASSLQQLKQIVEGEARQRATAEPRQGGDPACWRHLQAPPEAQ